MTHVAEQEQDASYKEPSAAPRAMRKRGGDPLAPSSQKKKYSSSSSDLSPSHPSENTTDAPSACSTIDDEDGCIINVRSPAIKKETEDVKYRIIRPKEEDVRQANNGTNVGADNERTDSKENIENNKVNNDQSANKSTTSMSAFSVGNSAGANANAVSMSTATTATASASTASAIASIDLTVDTGKIPTEESVERSLKRAEKRQALKNRTLKCTACTTGNDGEFIHAFLSIPICGACNKNVLDQSYPKAESGQELRCTWCGDGTYLKNVLFLPFA